MRELNAAELKQVAGANNTQNPGREGSSIGGPGREGASNGNPGREGASIGGPGREGNSVPNRN